MEMEKKNRQSNENGKKAHGTPQFTVLGFMNVQINDLKANGKWGTARNYSRTTGSFASFLDGTDIPFSLFNQELVARYNCWLQQREVTRNSISFYMRVLRAAYNKATELRLTEQSYPFTNVYTGVAVTRKRAVDEKIILQLLKTDLSASPSLALSRDLFVFSYCTRGMAFVDMAHLRKKEVSSDTISYYRHKTGKQLVIGIEPCIDEIIRRYGKMTKESPYVFPIISSEKPEKAYTQYQTALGYHNRKLKKLAKLIGLDTPLSTYTPRHTWATAARNRNIPIAVISAAMGHASEKTTQIYLDSFENSIIDQANRLLLSVLNDVVSI